LGDVISVRFIKSPLSQRLFLKYDMHKKRGTSLYSLIEVFTTFAQQIKIKPTREHERYRFILVVL
jgi:hypothetical protein